MERSFGFNYDADNDILFLYEKGMRSRGAIELLDGDFVLDIGTSRVVGLEVFDASKNLSDVNDREITKKVLKNLKVCKMRTISKKNGFMFVAGCMAIGIKEEIKIPLTVPCPIIKEKQKLELTEQSKRAR